MDTGQRRWHQQGGGRLLRWDGDAEQGRGVERCAYGVVQRSCRQDGNGRAFRDFPKEVGVPGAPVVVNDTPTIYRKSGSGVGVQRIATTRLKVHIVVSRIVFQRDIETEIATARHILQLMGFIIYSIERGVGPGRVDGRAGDGQLDTGPVVLFAQFYIAVLAEGEAGYGAEAGLGGVLARGGGGAGGGGGRGGGGQECPGGVVVVSAADAGGDEEGVAGARLQSLYGVGALGGGEVDEVEGFQPVAGGAGGADIGFAGPADAVGPGAEGGRPVDDYFAGVGAVADGDIGGRALGYSGGGGGVICPPKRAAAAMAISTARAAGRAARRALVGMLVIFGPP